ncbi:MAG TPA: hypothetical protein VLE27_00700, partial [Thermoanaerobaculia bacterium]|nr:hypothetical protein [Thermoanaerobaculia bacterium]
MPQKLLLASLVLCLFVFGGTPQAFAGQEDRETPTMDSIERLTSEGWRPVVEGVFQRDRGGSVVESIAFGPEGFAWRIEELRGRLAKMEAEQKAYPSKKLARSIAAQKREIARLQQALENGEVSSAQSATTQDKVIINGCDVTYGAHADAYYQTSSQGVGASANAHFTNNCGHSGHTEAYVYVRATLNGVTSTHSVFDPKDGNGITSNASWSLQGGPDCYSQASASVNSVSLGVSYSVFDENYECPQAPAPTVTITGPTSSFILGYNCRTLIWYANVSGGVAPFTYTWWRDGYYVGSGSSYSEQFCGSNFTYTETVNLQVDVADALSRGAWDTHSTTINYSR